MLCLILSIVLTACTGCQLFRPYGLQSGFGSGSLVGSGSAVLNHTIVKYDKMFGLFLLAVVGGVIAGMGGLKFGWVVAAGNMVGIGLYLTIARYSGWIAFGGLISGLVILLALVFRDRKFAFQNVKAIQTLKSRFPEMKEEINKILFVHQDSSSEKVVQQVKQKLRKDELKEDVKNREYCRANGGGEVLSKEIVSIPRKGQ